jgi:hypothetical protein
MRKVYRISYRVVVDDSKPNPRKRYESDAERMLRNIRRYERQFFGEGSRGPRPDHVRIYNEGVERLRGRRPSGTRENSVDRFNKGLKHIT